MKTFEQFRSSLREAEIPQRNRFNTKVTPWTPQEVAAFLDELDQRDSEYKVRFVFNDEFDLYLDTNCEEYGVSKQWEPKWKRGSTSRLDEWDVIITSDTEGADKAAQEMIRYDFQGEEPSKIYCVADDGKVWRSQNGDTFNPARKKFVICDMIRMDDEVIVTIDLA